MFSPSFFNNAFRLIGPPLDWALSQPFQSGREDSIYKKLYKKNMDGIKPFDGIENGLVRLVKSEAQALINNVPIHNYEGFHCMVSTYNFILHVLFEVKIEIFFCCCIDKAGMEKPCDFQHSFMGNVKKISFNTFYCPWTEKGS